MLFVEGYWLKKVTNQSTNELKSWYSLADTVLRNGDTFFIYV